MFSLVRREAVGRGNNQTGDIVRCIGVIVIEAVADANQRLMPYSLHENVITSGGLNSFPPFPPGFSEKMEAPV